MEFTVCFIALKILVTFVSGDSLDNCPPADPNCHPTCIVYTAEHCRYCMCDKGSARGTSDSGSGNSFSSGMSSDAAWDRGIEGGDWSSKMNSDSSAWSNTGGGSGYSSSGYSSGGHKETVKYVIVEKEPEPSYPRSPYGSGMGALSSLPNPFPAGMSSPFSGPHMPSALMPGSNNVVDSHSYGNNVIHVPLLAPGIPKYCVRCHILSCPGTCERVDEYGCRSCPCAPSRYQTMPVVKDCSHQEPVVMEPDCSATKLCIQSCSDGYQLGDKGRDGCRSCTCIRRAPPTRAPASNGCPATLSCMLKCKDGYLLGDKQADGCPSCKCLAKGAKTNSQSSSSNSNNKNNNNLGSGTNNWNSGASTNSGSSSGSSNKGSGCSGTKANYMTSVNGVGSGKCEPPMCLDGHMSVDQAMKIGTDSAGGGGGCNEGNGGTGVMDGGSTAGGSNSFGMNGGGFGNGMGGSSMGGMGGGGMGMGMGSMGTGSGGSSSSGSGMPSPFSVSMSGSGGGGGGGGMSMGGGGGGGGAGGSGMPFSPFSSAMSGGGPGKGMAPGMGGVMGMPGKGMAGMGMGSAMGTNNAVSATAYNKDCVGPECSAKNGMQHKDCPDLIHCLVTCDGSYKLGQLDDAGCQTCSCK